MTRRGLVAIGLYVCAFVGITGASVLLARGGRPTTTDQPAATGPIHVNGKGASAGNIGETTLHNAHIRGAQPIACPQCHQIRADGFAKPDRERCLGCHAERQNALHATVDDPKVHECTSCHDFLDTRPTAVRAWKCDGCHQHPHDNPLLMASKDLSQTCGRCHSPHGKRAMAPTTCIACHEDKATAHRATDDPAVGDCLACHRQHDDKRLAETRCAGCHADHEPRVPATATFAGGHEKCTGCHQPHQFSKKAVRACTGCHTGQKALAADRVGAHRDCLSCHDQHDVKTNAQRSCRRCHDRLKPSHPTNSHGDSCLGCHPAHPKRDLGPVPRLACSTCHTKARDDHAFHDGAGCTDCHRPHDFKLTLKPTFCLGCHARRVGQRAPVRTSAGHADCTRCHDKNPHAPARPPACGTCHGGEASTVPPGHATCTNCHNQHNGALRPGVATCVSCHTDRRQGPHVRIKGGCVNCHRTHGPRGPARPPACTTCHDRKALPGMHAVAKHADCRGCHDPHGPPPTRTETCLRCHTDKKNHQPGATSCIGCHQFSGNGKVNAKVLAPAGVTGGRADGAP